MNIINCKLAGLKPATASSAGQTLIETLVAIFILVMGITAAVGLAVYALSSSGNVTKQIIAVGLAREGLEAVRNMRDTNWLNDAVSSDCYNFATAQATGKCYHNWITQMFCLDPTSNNGNCNGSGTSQNYYLGFDSADSNFWVFQRQDNPDNYGLYFDKNNSSGLGFYNVGASGVDCTNTAGISEYCRKITIVKDSTTVPFNQALPGPKLIVTAQVWWTDKKCPRSADWPGEGKCSLQLETELTNWKNY